MRQAAHTKRTAAHSPAAGPSGKTQFHGVRRFTFETCLETKLRGSETQEAFAGAGEQTLARAVDEAQLALIVEGKDGYVELFHDRAQQTGGFHGAQPLRAKRLAQGVDFQHDLAERVVGAGLACAEGKVLFAHR